MKAPTISIALLAAGVLAMPAVAARSHHSTSPNAIIGPKAGGIAVLGDPTSYSTGFNSEEGFIAETPLPQQGWVKFDASLVQPTIEAENAFEGDQHLRVSIDGSVPPGNLIGGFSPDLALGVEPGNITSEMTVIMFVSELGGADYTVAGQSPMQGQLAARVIFDFQGNMVVLDEIAGSLAFTDSEYDYPIGQHFQLTVRLDNETDVIDYYINTEPTAEGGDGDLVYTSEGGVYAATSIDQAVLFSDNFHIADYGDWDQLSFANGFPVLCTPAPDGDTNNDGFTDFADLLNVLSTWGPCPDGCLGDTDCNGLVEFTDLLTVLSGWNPPS